MLASLYLPFAESCSLAPADSEAPPLTEIELRAACVTWIVAEPVTPPWVAETVTEPCLKLVSKPEAFVAAREESEVFHAACEVRLLEVPSLYLPVAASCNVWPAAIEVAEFAAVTLIDSSVGVLLEF